MLVAGAARRTRRLPRVAGAACVAWLAGASVARGQSRLTTEGAPFLLIPVGAQALGLGQATIADQSGTEAVWWNPAGLARSDKRELAVHHFGSVVATGDVVSFLVPSSLLGVLAGSVYIVNYGSQEIPGPPGTGTIGTFKPLNIVYAATYATPIGSRVNAGITFKIIQLRVECSGICGDVPVLSASTTAIDFGAQYDVSGLAPLTLGVAVRHLGPKLQVNDRAQADPLPTRIQIGVQYRVVPVARTLADVDLHINADIVDELNLGSPAAHLGADVAWRKRAHFRAGYVFDDSEASGPAIGVGLVAGNLRLDIGRQFESFSQGLGQAPTYVSLRYLF